MTPELIERVAERRAEEAKSIFFEPADRTPIEANIPLDGEWTVIGIEDMGDPVVHLLRYDSNTCVRAYAGRIVSCVTPA